MYPIFPPPQIVHFLCPAFYTPLAVFQFHIAPLFPILSRDQVCNSMLCFCPYDRPRSCNRRRANPLQLLCCCCARCLIPSLLSCWGFVQGCSRKEFRCCHFAILTFCTLVQNLTDSCLSLCKRSKTQEREAGKATSWHLTGAAPVYILSRSSAARPPPRSS